MHRLSNPFLWVWSPRKKCKGNKLTKEVNYPFDQKKEVNYPFSHLFFFYLTYQKLHKALQCVSINMKMYWTNPPPFTETHSFYSRFSSSHSSFLFFFNIKLSSFYFTLLFSSFFNPSASEIRILICFLCLFFFKRHKKLRWITTISCPFP